MSTTTTTHENGQGLQLQSDNVGALPLLNRFIKRMRLEEFLRKRVPAGDPRQKLEPAVGLLLLLRNIMISRTPLYRLGEWAERFDPRLLGLPAEALDYLNDDRSGRCLDLLFRADRGTLTTEIVVWVAKEFDLDLTQLHNDSTTITVTGEYPDADGQPAHGQATHRIARGHSKDYRPDLKQLLFILTTTADGSVPIWCNVDHGNTTDDTTHIATWDTLHKLTGRPDFLYVADCKLASAENTSYIDQNGGRFVTVMPATWREHAQFYEQLRTSEIPWIDVLSKPSARSKKDTPAIYRGYEHPQKTSHGFRVLWYWSSQKAANDRTAREHRIESVERALQELRERVGQPRSRLKTIEAVTEAAQKIVSEKNAEAWVNIQVETQEVEYKEQMGPGRPGANTPYRVRKETTVSLHWQLNAQALQDEAATDGVFPLLTNDRDISVKDTLVAYKHQPSLEKRHQQLKSVLQVRPVMLQNHLRIEALLFVYFLALLTEALIERETRNRMRKLELKQIAIYGEGKPSSAPTTDALIQLLDGLRRYRLVDKSGRVVQRFYDEVSDAQRVVMRLHNLTAQQYMSAAEEDVGRG